MAYIKAQKIIRDEQGRVIGGSASIIDTVVDLSSNKKPKKRVRERLGRVLYLSEDRKTGIFESPTRGLVEYCSIHDRFEPVSLLDPRLGGACSLCESSGHQGFGEVYLLLQKIIKNGFWEVMKGTFEDKMLLQGILEHILYHLVLGAGPVSVSDFVSSTFLSRITGTDNVYWTDRARLYEELGQAGRQESFFRQMITLNQQEEKDSHRCTWTDFWKIPETIRSWFETITSKQSVMIPESLYIVFDAGTDLPVWMGTSQEKNLSRNAAQMILADTLLAAGLELDGFVLDNSEVSLESLKVQARIPDRFWIARSPRTREFHFKSLYHQVKGLIPNAKYEILSNGRAYFATRRKVELGGQALWAYIYVDQLKALSAHLQALSREPGGYKEMSQKEKNWNKVQYGYFMLLANQQKNPADLLRQFQSRMNMEKLAVRWLDMEKGQPEIIWTSGALKGKLLLVMMIEMVQFMLEQTLTSHDLTLADFLGKTRTLMARFDGHNRFIVERPLSSVVPFFQALDVPVPASLEVDVFAKDLFG